MGDAGDATRPNDRGDGDARAASAWAGVVKWLVACGALVAVAWLVLDLLRQCSPVSVVQAGGNEARAALKTLADALKPTVSSTPLVVLRGEDDTPKLVVYTHAADVEVELVEDHWYGDTCSRVAAKGCRAQFVVPLDGVTDRDVVLVPAQGGAPARILVLVPRPRVDEEMLAVAPESVVFTERNTGLRHARAWVGVDNRDELVKQLRPRLVEAVSRPEVRARADRAAREFFERRFAEWLRAELEMGRDVEVEVRWVEGK
jgi:hypothetical protein